MKGIGGEGSRWKEKGEREGGDDGTQSRRNMWKDVATYVLPAARSKRINGHGVLCRDAESQGYYRSFH